MKLLKKIIIMVKKNKNRQRKIIWFNPPYGKQANIDLGKYFLILIDKHI